jgi:heme-degrading monooxygenase HmoA
MSANNNFEAIVPTGPNFRELPIEEAFTWEQAIQETDLAGLYVVVFRSLRNLAAGREKIGTLLKLDNQAHEDARKSEGFRVYWHDDELSPEGYGVSFCAWDSQAHAEAAADRRRHQAAANYVKSSIGRNVYVFYKVEGYEVRRTDDGLHFDRVK